MAHNPYEPPAASSLEPANLADTTAHLVRPLYEVKGWLKLIGVLNIIIGVIYCITIIGAVIGWIPLLLGIKANRSSNDLKEGLETHNQNKVQEGIQQLAACIKIIGILTLVILILNVIGIAVQLGGGLLFQP